jgi:glycosyltransferase involved in cell wall biosynthesis
VQPEVSVVIPTLDRLDYLREAVASVRSQEGVAHELIVVDNGSTDGTREWLATQSHLTALHADRDPARPRSANTSAARNAGLSHAGGAYVWFLDDDDRLRPGALATLAAVLDEHPDAIAAVGARTRFGDNVMGGRVAHPLRRVVRDLRPELLLSWGWIPSQALCRASALQRAGNWWDAAPHSEDLELWARMGALGPVVLEPVTVVEYRVHRSQTRLRDPVARRDMLLRPHATALAGGNATRGRALRQAGRWWDRANVAFAAGEHRRALAATLRAAALAPRLLQSPATGPLVTRMLVRSALRSTGPTRRWVESRPARHPGERPRRGTGFLS